LAIAVAATMTAVSAGAMAAGDAALGKAKSITCAACHGEDGKREVPLWSGGSSHLAGMNEQKILDAMRNYRNGQRFHPMMQFFLMPMNDKDLADVSAYYAGLKDPLYKRLGGKEAINAVVKDLLSGVASDPRLAPRFSKMDAAKCERLLTDFLCEGTGGPCKYTGRDMKTAHKGAKVTEIEWQAFAENLGKTFDRFNVPAQERQELLQMIGPMKVDIVGL